MPKTTKKTTTKKTTVKKTIKKTAKTSPVTKVAPVITEIPEPSRYCHCTKRKRNIILTCVFTGSFILGIVVSQLFFCCGCNHHKHFPRVEFVNGCADVASIKCPKMLEQLPAIDADHDGCITKSELHAAKKMMRHHHEKPVAEPDVNVEDAIAPVME